MSEKFFPAIQTGGGTLVRNLRRTAGSLLNKALPLRFGWMNLMVTCTQIYFFILYSVIHGIELFDVSVRSALEILFSLVTINILVQILNLVTQRSRVVRLIAQETVLLCLWLANAYYLKTHVQLDFSLVADNISLVFSGHSLSVIKASFDWKHLAAALFIAVWMALAERKSGSISRVRQEKPLLIKTILSILLYAAAVIAPIASHDQITSLIQDAFHRAFPGKHAAKPVTGFPYLKKTVEISGRFSNSPADRPDILLVMIESFNANFVEAKTADGREITPVFNRLIREGIYYDRFYGNSVQTCKGQAAVLLSVLPGIKGKIFTSYPHLRFKALPSYLTDAGYDTVFMQSEQDLDFDNTADFMKRAGFSEVRSAYEFISRADRAAMWGYGPEDGLFYQSFFSYLDRRKKANGGRPVFAMLATIANHMPFNEMPADRKILYPKPVNMKQNYANSIHLSDRQLRKLIDMIRKRPALANTVVIITGDHSYPAGEHGYTHNESGYYDESFRIPFLILWNGHLSGQRIRSQVRSQVDIAPTILDLAGVRTGWNSFIGRSLFLENSGGESVYLIQPYHGGFLQSLRYPYKYIYHRKSEREYLFDLVADPLEKNNLVRQAPADLLREMRSDLETIYFNQRILDTNSLYP